MASCRCSRPTPLQVSEKAKLEAAEAMLRDSGMLELEQRVLQFLVSNAAAIKLESILDDAQRLLHTVSKMHAPGWRDCEQQFQIASSPSCCKNVRNSRAIVHRGFMTSDAFDSRLRMACQRRRLRSRGTLKTCRCRSRCFKASSTRRCSALTWSSRTACRSRRRSLMRCANRSCSICKN